MFTHQVRTADSEVRLRRTQKIEADELKTALKSLAEGIEDWTDAEHEELFAFLDVDQDGKISKVVTCFPASAFVLLACNEQRL